MKKIAIIGAGYTGLGLADNLKEDYEIDVIESKKTIGGMTETFSIYGTRLEYFYRHIFKCDTYVIDLAKKLNLDNLINWDTTKMGYYVKNSGSYLFGTPISLLKFKPLNLWNKLRFGMGYIQIKLIRDYHKLENIPADVWMKEHFGLKSYECIFEPLLISKFGPAYKDVSMVWLWNKLVARSSSSKSDGESLGYMKGSYGLLTDKYVYYLKKHHVNFILNTKVNKIVKNNNKYNLKTNNKELKDYDIVISTVALPYLYDLIKDFVYTKYLKKVKGVKYTATKTLILFMNKSYMPYYWLNIGDKNCPFGGLIEHTNMINEKNYKNHHILYVSNYLYETDKCYKMNKEELFKTYLPYLKEINPDFDESWVEKMEVYEERYAQQIVTKNYSKNIPETKIDNENIYVASMAQIYPEDRGMNNALKIAYEVSKEIKNNEK